MLLPTAQKLVQKNIFLSFIIFLMGCSSNNNRQTPQFHCDTLVCLPDFEGRANPGVAGAFSGVSHDKLLVAGGANFPDKPAWQNGVKKYWETVYVLSFDQGIPGKWEDTLFHLPYPSAYGASLTTAKGIICIGGKNDGGYLAKALLLQWNEQSDKIDIKYLPDLPLPLASLAAASLGDTIYIAGGENGNGKQACFYQLDLQHVHDGWKPLAPLPGGPLSDAILAGQSDGENLCLYLIGGRAQGKEGAATFYSSVYKFDPGKGHWQKMHGITGEDGSPMTMAAGTGAAVGNHYIALFGGDDGKLFNLLADYKRKIATAEDPSRKQQWQQRYDSLFTRHPGFNKGIYLYNTITDQWTVSGKLSCPAPVTTNIFPYGEKFIISSGEIRPGVRTAAILAAKIDSK